MQVSLLLEEGTDPLAADGAAVSRIWDALKQAETERSRTKGRKRAPESVDASSREHPNSDGADRRRSKRWEQPVPVLLYGSDSEKQPFHEETETMDINDDGCSFTIATEVVIGQRLFLVNMLNDAERECRVIQAPALPSTQAPGLASVQAPAMASTQASRPSRGKSLVAVEFSGPAPDFWTARKR